MVNPFVYRSSVPATWSDDFSVVWTYVSDAPYKCGKCHGTGGKGDTVVAVGYADSEARPVLCLKCFEAIGEAA